eukprot:CAMPEP_0170565896 /NCGR_PEP_ID=MMETSP0211-20121228/79480_1 /TAXON_ID=311385 /ORGANISM="Pseudokeronopsis sp., Strain OXSARD2" /LENGTH=42 /DNA_ID= /DNA_START= /DNA_END= /DNA_ORIENTATION=
MVDYESNSVYLSNMMFYYSTTKLATMKASFSKAKALWEVLQK